MIVVITGNGVAFTRLLNMVRDVAHQSADEVFWVQYGSGRLPSGTVGAAFAPHEEVLQRMAEATAVICHGGSGAIGDALATGHYPIAVARRGALREHVNDHQLDLCDALEREGRIVVVEDAAQLTRALAMVATLGRRLPDRSKANELAESVAQAVSEALPNERCGLRWRSAVARVFTLPFRRLLVRTL